MLSKFLSSSKLHSISSLDLLENHMEVFYLDIKLEHDGKPILAGSQTGMFVSKSHLLSTCYVSQVTALLGVILLGGFS